MNISNIAEAINSAEYDEMLLEYFGLWSYWNAAGELKSIT